MFDMQTKGTIKPIQDRAKREWLLLVTSLVLIGLILGSSLRTEHSKIAEREQVRLSTHARIIDTEVARSLEVIDRTLKGFVADLPANRVQKDGMARISNRFRAFADAMRMVRTFMLTDAQGNVLASNRPELVGMNFSRREYFQAVVSHPKEDQLYVGPPFKTALGVWSFNVVRMVPGSNGEFGGIVSSTIDLDELRAIMRGPLHEEDMWSSLIHGDGQQILMEPDQENQSGKEMAQPGSILSRHLASGKDAQVLEGISAATGKNRLTAIRTIHPPSIPMDKPLLVVIGRDIDALYASWDQRLWSEGGLFALLAAFSVPALYFLQQRRLKLETAKTKADIALAESERFMRSLIDISPGMVSYWDADLCCRFANAAYKEWFGRSPDAMQGIHWRELVGEDEFLSSKAFLRATLDGHPQNFEYTRTKADGTTGYTWAHFVPDMTNGQVVGFFAIFSDVAPIKEIQTQLEASNAALKQRSHEAEAASRAKSAFVANMSHEIRTPMNAVLGLLQLLQLTHLDGRQLDYLQKAKGAAQSLLGLLNDILDFSKIEANKLSLDCTPFRLDTLLRDLSVVLASSLQSKEVEVLFHLDPSVPRALKGDGLRLQQVLLNLASNAIKFTEHGEVVVALRVISDMPDAVEIEFSVRDTGIGIPSDVLPRLFSAFEQADVSTTRRYGGTGLGLAISYRLVQLMGGVIEVESLPSRGSCFHFAVRFQKDAETRTLASIAAESYGARKPLRVLIVDDNATAREVLAATAASFHWQVTTANSGTEAIEQLLEAEVAGEPFDVLCIDWIMPGMDGWETIQHVKEKHKGSLPAILMITAHGRELIEERIKHQPHAVDNFLVKPVTPSMLFDAVVQVVGGASVTDVNKAAIDSGGTSTPLAGLNILLVEDHPLNQQVARELLTHAGARVEVADNGQRGIDCVKDAKIPFDVILMDIQMPVMDGFAATSILRSQMGIVTPIIAMTANAMPADRAACLAAGMDDHIGKPIDNRELIARILLHCAPKAEIDVNHVPRCLPSLPDVPEGFELTSALERIDGNTQLFATLCRLFGPDAHTLVSNTSTALHQGNRAAAARDMHTLKGVAASLGAQSLYQQALKAETALKKESGDDDERLILEVAAGVDSTITVLTQIANTLESQEGALEGPTLTPEVILAHLDELDCLLAQQNMRAIDIFNTIWRDASPDLADKLTSLNDALQQLDFCSAREKVVNLRVILTQ